MSKDKLDKELAAFAGEEFVAEVKRAHADYGAAIGATKAKGAAADPTRLAEPLRAVASAVTFYATQVAATVDPEEPATVESARASLAPIDVLRAGQARRSRASGSGTMAGATAGATGAVGATDPSGPLVSPTSPVPEVPKG